MIISISMAVVRTCKLDARRISLNMRYEIIIIIIGDGGGGGDDVLYFASYWLERELLCINNVANFFSISLLNYSWKMKIYSKRMDRYVERKAN
jgi:hypothetical protein